MLLTLTVLFPILAGIAVSLRDAPRRTRRVRYAAVTLCTDLLGAAAALRGTPVELFYLTERIPLCFTLDRVGRFFLLLVLTVYTCACFYAFEYLENDERDRGFFAFWFASFGAMLAVCMAGNLVSLYLCFELATLSSMPMVLHDRTKASNAAALKYLFYSVGGALLGLFAVMALCLYGSGVFTEGGFLSEAATAAHAPLLRAAAFAGIVGFGAKAGMYPLHGWLPAAHPVAPAPASALLSGIVAKAGILAVIRLVYYAAGTPLLRGSWVQTAWMCLALVTVFMGSMMAWRESVMKKRLAYSTVSQLSYIMLSLSLLCPDGLRGALLHAAAHATSKSVLFLCAGAFIHCLGASRVGDLRGVGQRMPVTMLCFFTASLSLVGIPPMGGFTSKWQIALSALREAPGPFAYLIPVTLLLSALLTAGYLLPVTVNGFFPERGETPADPISAEPGAWMTVPMVLLCLGALAVGLFGVQVV